MNNKKNNINLVQHLWLAHNQERNDQLLLLSIGYLWKQLDHQKKIFKNESMINKDMAMMNYASEKSMQESWRRGTDCDGEGQVDV
jgi:hypothetical protein